MSHKIWAKLRGKKVAPDRGILVYGLAGKFSIDNELIDITQPWDMARHCKESGSGSVLLDVYGEWGKTLIVKRIDDERGIGYQITVILKKAETE